MPKEIEPNLTKKYFFLVCHTEIKFSTITILTKNRCLSICKKLKPFEKIAMKHCHLLSDHLVVIMILIFL